MKCSSYEKHNGDFRSEAAGGSINVRSVLLLAGRPGDTEETPTKNTTGTSGPRRPVDPCSKCSSFRRVPLRHRRNVYEKRNGDFRSEAAVGFVFGMFFLPPGAPATQRNRLRKSQRELQVRSCRWIRVRRILFLGRAPGDTEETLTKIATGTPGPKRPLDAKP